MTRALTAARSLPSLLLIVLVRAYQLLVSPLLGPTCRFYPSCSAYAVAALRRHGALRGGWLTIRRLARCNPWNPGGVDHVPSRRSDPHDPHDHHGPSTSSTLAA